MRALAVLLLVSALAGCAGEPGVPEALVAEARKQVEVDWGPNVSLVLSNASLGAALREIAAKGGPAFDGPSPDGETRLSGSLYDVPGLIAFDAVCLHNGILVCIFDGKLVPLALDEPIDFARAIEVLEKLPATRRGRGLRAALHAVWNLRAVEGVTATDIEKWSSDGK